MKMFILEGFVQALKSEVLPADMTVKQIMDSWTVQTGYPVLNVTRDYDSGNAVITQVSGI